MNPRSFLARCRFVSARTGSATYNISILRNDEISSGIEVGAGEALLNGVRVWRCLSISSWVASRTADPFGSVVPLDRYLFPGHARVHDLCGPGLHACRCAVLWPLGQRMLFVLRLTQLLHVCLQITYFTIAYAMKERRIDLPIRAGLKRI